jgi:thiamine-phosphate pyrophosphorylase
VAEPVVHAVTDDAVLEAADFVRRAAAVLEAGGRRVAVHLRGPRTGGRRLHELASALRAAASRHGGLLVVNDRVDVALAAGAGGVQLGERSLSPRDCRRIAGERLRVGASVHAGCGAERAAGADWLLAGAVWATGSHPDRPAAGPGLLHDLVPLGLPVIAIGGVTPARVAAARSAGAAGVAALGGIWGAADPAAAVEAYLDAWRER